MCKLTKQSDVVKVLPFAEFFVSPLWPFGRVIKTSSGFHGECDLLIVYLGENLKEANQTIKSLVEHYLYCKTLCAMKM